MKISEFIKRLNKYKKDNGDVEVAMYERVLSPNYMNYTRNDIDFFQDWIEHRIFTEEDVEKMSRRKLLKKYKELYDESAEKGISNEELKEAVLEASDEIEVLALGICGED